ncbi:MAG TPA: type III secretion system ATPase SctN [Methylibium sp.]|uniref:type III secretion system ATPase SctN n=1 Tax=Methylibium sp. TaxID=2067992 RepID=UPI002DBC295A|nr:type III secretion system ATPase SctN [Methylibium sp.]HEU4459566.1 type III secretion system ATPase SctN [Methylibium sp.]
MKLGRNDGLGAVERLASLMESELATTKMLRRTGKVVEVIGTLMRVAGLDAQVGELCELLDESGEVLESAEVVGFAGGRSLLSPFGSILGVRPGTQVAGSGKILAVPVGDRLLGRVIDSLGRPIDGHGAILTGESRPVFALPPSPMERAMIGPPLPTGVKAIDGLITLAEGQRMGIFAPAGVGKSTLMGMLARGTQCDISVIALIGERGREVREFVEDIMGEEGMARSVVVCATSDRSSIERAKAAHTATTVAEYFRDRGLKVLLMMDSLTRFARAQREIGLAAGEPPARRGFPPSVFAEIPRLLERAGMGIRGSITALYTVLAEDESSGDPISEEVRGILDGHMVLSRKIAARNQYPAIDVLGSLSRVMSQVVAREHREAAGKLRKLMARHDELELLIQLGEYKQGGDPLADEAVAKIAAIKDLLSQPTDHSWVFDDTVELLMHIARS